MPKAILLTGAPGSGKTTLIKRVLLSLSLPAGGFYTEEIRERGERKGFQLVTLDGREGVLAHVDIASPPSVGNYHLDLEVMESVGVASLRQAMRTGRIVVVDEIGPMELQCAAFRGTVLEVLDSGAVVLGTIVRRDTPFTKAIKARPDVAVMEVTRANRETLVSQIATEIQQAAAARRKD